MFSKSPVRAILNWISTPVDFIMVLVGLLIGLAATFATFFFTGTPWPTAIVITVTLLVVVCTAGVTELLVSILFALLLKLSGGLVASMLTAGTTLTVFIEVNKIIEATPFPQLALGIFVLGEILALVRDYITSFRR
jgi:hypothetical protein